MRMKERAGLLKLMGSIHFIFSLIKVLFLYEIKEVGRESYKKLQVLGSDNSSDIESDTNTI